MNSKTDKLYIKNKKVEKLTVLLSIYIDIQQYLLYLQVLDFFLCVYKMILN